MLSLDHTVPTPVQQGQSVKLSTMQPVQPEAMQSGGCMIFLRRDTNNWVVAFHGLRGLSSTPMPLPFTRSEPLRDVLAYLGKQYAGQLSGAWLLVAP
jgi:hypothetical protein